jgi:leader peptidase (prepilin peptidase)/N-methyltransferase
MRVTAFVALAIGAAALAADGAAQAAAHVVFLCALAHVAVIDGRLMVAPVRLCLALAATGVLYAAFDGGARAAGEHAAAALVGWASFRLLDRAHVRLRGRPGLGEGDALIAAALGAWLSLQGLALAVGAGGAATLAAMRLGGNMGRAFPFAPGLALGAFFVLMVKQFG